MDPRKIFSFTVSEKRFFTKDIFSLRLTPDQGEIFAFHPGQFVMLRLLNPDSSLWRQKAYSLMTAPQERKYIELGIKIAGPFTQRTAQLQQGDRVDVAGPYGVFTYDEQVNDAVFLAGGIGIAPFMSMIRHTAATSAPHRILLLFHNRTKQDIPFLEELSQKHASLRNVHIHFFVDQGEPPVGGSVGLLSEDQLVAYHPDFSRNIFYLCGPPPFMEEAKAILLKHGVTKDRIKIERF